MAQSSLLAEVLAKTVRECLKVWLDGRETSQSKAELTPERRAFRQELFPSATLNMALKLLIIVCQNAGDKDRENLDLIREVLPAEFLKKAFDLEACKEKKMSDIGRYLKDLIHPVIQDAEQDKQKTLQTARSQSEAVEARKALAAKKKAALLAKMKKKHTNFLGSHSNATAKASHVERSAFEEEDTVMEEPKTFSQSCASCQEPLDLDRFFERPFAQLCYLSQTKLLYYTCHQTVESQKKSLKNLRDARTFMPSEVVATPVVEEEERKQPSLGSSSFRDSQSEVSSNVHLEEDPHPAWDKLVLEDLQLAGVIDKEYKTGVSFNKCCHGFHLDCLQRYQTAENTLDFQRSYMKEMIGQDEGCIQCPMCKTFKNTWQPFLPLGLDHSVAGSRGGVEILNPYIDFCS